MIRRIAVVTVARSDYGIYRPLLRAMTDDPALELQLIAAGGHLAADQGGSLAEIEADGIRLARIVDCGLASDRPGAMSRAMGLATICFAQAFEELVPDILVLLGDRFEMHAAAVAAQPLAIPIAHLCGGSVTRGAVDDAFRHSISKLSHLHLTECKAHAERLARLGEADWRIKITGSLAMDNLSLLELLSLDEIMSRFGLTFDRPPLLVTFHSATREYKDVERQTDVLIAALTKRDEPVVLTQPNVDPGGRLIAARFQAFAANHPNRVAMVPHLGTQAYFSMMALSAAMIGNSSSGIFESASFRLPVVNVGRRQEGRFQPPNVVQCDTTENDIAEAIDHALSPAFRAGLGSLANPYGDGSATPRMLDLLKSLEINEDLLVKEAF